MLSKVFAIAQKDILLRFANRAEIIFFFILPAVFTFALGGGFGGDPQTEAQAITIVNNDTGRVATEFITTLSNNENVEVAEVTAEEAQASLDDQAISGYLIIPADMTALVLSGQEVALEYRRSLNDITNAQAQEQIIQVAMSAVVQVYNVANNSVQAAAEQQAFADDAARDAYFEEAQSLGEAELAEVPERVMITYPETTTIDANDSASATAAHQSAGQLVTWVFIPLLGTSAFLAGERRWGTLRRLLTTPTNNTIYLLGTVVGQFSAGMVQMTVLILFGMFVMGINWGNSILGVIIMMISFGLASVALGTMLGAFVDNEGQASGLSTLLGMALALLGGCWWPIEFFPENVQTVVKIFPTTWAMQAFSDLVLRGLGVQDILFEAAVLCLFAITFFVIGVYRFRYE